MNARFLWTAFCALLLAACSGGPMVPLTADEQRNHSHIVHAQTGDAPTKIAYAGSPVSKTVAYINSAAIEPGASWLGANDIGAQSYGRWTVNAGETARIVPRLIFDYAPGRRPDPELEAQVRRAFKLWTRHLTGVRGYEFRTWTTIVEVGHQGACGGDSNALACVWDATDPANPHGLPILQIPAAQAALVASANSPITLLSTLAHEAGHALGYRHPVTGQPHAPSSSRQLMSPYSGDSVTIGPQAADLLGVGHTFWYGAALSPEYFGWWLDAAPTSNLRSLGSGVARHFDVAEVAGSTGVAANSVSVTSDSLTSDYVKVSAWVDDTPTPPEYLGRSELGSATWTGFLLAVDTSDYSPVGGRAELSMDLSALRLAATFDNFVSTADVERWADTPPLRYTLTENASGVWHDSLGRVDARFFAEFTPSGTVADPAYTAAGHLNDKRVGILGAYGATKED